jgi:hypothetical protein
MATKSITSANSIILLSITGLFPVPQQLQGFAADDIFDVGDIAPAEISMGVDGKLSAGYVNVPVPLGIMLQADSDSNDLFDAWYAANRASGDIYFANGVVRLPSVQRSFALKKGVLMGYKPAPDGKKILQPRKYSIMFESMIGAPI